MQYSTSTEKYRLHSTQTLEPYTTEQKYACAAVHLKAKKNSSQCYKRPGVGQLSNCPSAWLQGSEAKLLPFSWQINLTDSSEDPIKLLYISVTIGQCLRFCPNVIGFTSYAKGTVNKINERMLDTAEYKGKQEIMSKSLLVLM